MASEILLDLTNTVLMGLLLGGLYALIALGLSLVFGVMKMINVAHGDLILFGTYFAYAAMTLLGIDPILSLIVGVPLLSVIGFGIQRYLMSRAFGRSMEAPLLIAFGISLMLQNLQQILWSPMSKGLTTSYALDSFELGGIHVPLAYLLDFAAAVVVMVFLSQFLGRTYLGKAITGAAQDKTAAQLMGINTGRVYAFAFAISMATAAFAGVFLGLTFPFTPQSGISFLIIAFGVVIVGGLGSTVGTFLGGMVLGVAQTLGGFFLGPTSQMLVVYFLILLVLAVRPQGLFGR
jgi:branched-chain amino acid transport system permease protein